MTTGAAIVFMLTSLTLAYFSSRRPTSSLMPATAPAPVTQQTQGAPAESQVPAPVQSEATLPESAAENLPAGPVSQPAPKPAPELPEKG
jgi:preprotein translocase subunit SecG